MILVTSAGAYLALQHPEDPRTLVIHCRDRASAQTLVDGVETLCGAETRIEEDGQAGATPYRVEVSRENFSAWLAFEAREYLDYENFSDAVTTSRGARWRVAADQAWQATSDVTDSWYNPTSPHYQDKSDIRNKHA